MELKEALATKTLLSVEHLEEVDEIKTRSEEIQYKVSVIEQDIKKKEDELKKKLDETMAENQYYQHELIDSKMKVAELTQQNDELSVQFKKMEKQLAQYKAKYGEKK
jgi:uncharacterized coiled-coil DUF342 family protein